jgi:hypothetical protein
MNKSLAIVVAIAGISCATGSAHAQRGLETERWAHSQVLSSAARSAWSQAASSITRLGRQSRLAGGLEGTGIITARITDAIR